MYTTYMMKHYYKAFAIHKHTTPIKKKKNMQNKLKLRVRIHYRPRPLPEMRLLTRISIRAKNYRKRYQRERHVQAITTSMDLA